MKKTDIIIRMDPRNQPEGALQIVVLDISKYGTQIIELDRPKFIAVPLEEGEWAKLSTDKRETVKLNNLDVAPRSIFDYICYTITAEKKGSTIEPNCEYFVSCSTPYKPTKKTRKSLTPVSNSLKRASS